MNEEALKNTFDTTVYLKHPVFHLFLALPFNAFLASSLPLDFQIFEKGLCLDPTSCLLQSLPELLKGWEENKIQQKRCSFSARKRVFSFGFVLTASAVVGMSSSF